MTASETKRARARRREVERAERKAQRRSRTHENRALRARALPNKPLLVPALLGLGLASYLTGAVWLETSPLACGVGSGCELVQSSRFASFLGIPTAAWGLAAYAGLAATAVGVRRPRVHWILSAGLSGTALSVSLYLTGISIFEIGATCGWCLASLSLVAICFAVSLAQRPGEASELARRVSIVAVALASTLLVGVLHLHYQGVFDPAAGPENPRLRALAEHLTVTGARFYGASWCPHCADQKEIFAGSADRLDYVECAPDGPRTPQAPACRAAGIESYPTWVIGGELHEGLLAPQSLALLSGFPWQEPTVTGSRPESGRRVQ